MNFGENLKMIRKANGLTQREVSARLGVTPQAVCKWETNTTEPDMATVARLCLILGCTTDDLTGHETAPLSPLERELVSLFRRSSAETREIVMTVLKSRAEASS